MKEGTADPVPDMARSSAGLTLRICYLKQSVRIVFVHDRGVVELVPPEGGARGCEGKIGDRHGAAIAERQATGFVFTEGPLWHPDGYYYFNDINPGALYRLKLGGKAELVRKTAATCGEKL